MPDLFKFFVRYNGIDAVQAGSPGKPSRRIHASEISYTDYLTGQSDEIEIVAADPDKQWTSGFFPDQNDSVQVVAQLGDRRLDFGEFWVDSVENSLYPDKVKIKGLSIKIAKSSELRKKRTVQYEGQTLRGIVSGVAQRNGLELQWSGADEQLDTVTQRRQSDLAFLQTLAESAGFMFKVYKKKVIFQEITAFLDGAEFVRTGDDLEFLSGPGSRYIEIGAHDLIGAPSFELFANYKDRGQFKRAKPYEATVERLQQSAVSGDGYDGGEDQAKYNKISVEAAGKNAVSEAAMAGIQVALPVVPHEKWLAGNVVYVGSWAGKYRGTYLITQVTHTISAKDGWSVSIDSLRRLSSSDAPKPTQQQRNEKRSIRQTILIEASNITRFVEEKTKQAKAAIASLVNYGT